MFVFHPPLPGLNVFPIKGYLKIVVSLADWEVIGSTVAYNVNNGIEVDDECDGIFKNTIIWGNYEGGTGGKQVRESGINAQVLLYHCCFSNGAEDISGDVTPDAYCITAYPEFANFVAGDLRLLSYSPCVDAGSDTAANLCMDTYTTRTDHVSDAGIVDMGYHYPTIPADIDKNGSVDFFDYGWFAMLWPYETTNQIPRGSVVVDGDLCLVETVRSPVVVGKVFEIDRLAADGIHPFRQTTGKEIDQVEVVAAFFHQRTAGVGVELVPLPHLVEKRKAVFQHVNAVHLADGITIKNFRNGL